MLSIVLLAVVTVAAGQSRSRILHGVVVDSANHKQGFHFICFVNHKDE